MAVVPDAGFKGGEIVPTFFIGATFGAVVGPLLCIPSGFAAAIGLVAMFAGVTNTVIASIFLAIEVFGGYNGLYSSQRILYSKVRPEYINLRTNHNHLIKSSRFARMMHGEKPAEHNDNEAGGS